MKPAAIAFLFLAFLELAGCSLPGKQEQTANPGRSGGVITCPGTPNHAGGPSGNSGLGDSGHGGGMGAGM